MSGTQEPQSGPSDSAPLRISYHRDHTLIKLQSTIIRLQLTIIFFPPPKNFTFFERIRFPFKIGTGQVDNTAGICPLLLKQECRKNKAQRILVDNTPEACPLLSHKESRKIKGLWVLVDKEKRSPYKPGITQQGLYTRNGWLIRANHYTLRADNA